MDVRAAGDSTSIDKAKKASISNFSNDKYNWLLHLHFVRKNFEACKTLADKLQNETKSNCDYAAYIKGQVLRLEGNVNESLKQFQLSSALNSHSTAGFVQVARSLFLLARHKAALDVYKEAEKLSPNDWKISYDKGVCYIYNKDLKSAKDCLQRALSLKPNELSHIMLAKVHLAEKNLEMAIASYQKALEISPENTEILSTLGLLYMQLGDHQKAFDCLGSALTFDPSNFKAILAVGSMLQLNGDQDVALGKYRHAAQVSGVSESGCLWNNMGMCFFSKKKYVAAITCLKRAHYLSPFHWKVLYNLALIHCTMQQFASAFHFVTSAISLRSKSPQLFMLLAVVLTNLNDRNNAKHAYIQAVKIDENQDPLILLNFAIFLCNSDQVKLAKDQFFLLQKNPKLKNYSSDEEFQTMYQRLSAYLHLADGT